MLTLCTTGYLIPMTRGLMTLQTRAARLPETPRHKITSTQNANLRNHEPMLLTENQQNHMSKIRAATCNLGKTRSLDKESEEQTSQANPHNTINHPPSKEDLITRLVPSRATWRLNRAPRRQMFGIAGISALQILRPPLITVPCVPR